MKEIIYKCNVCNEIEDDQEVKLVSMNFDSNELFETDDKQGADIHVCTVCLKAIKEFEPDKE